MDIKEHRPRSIADICHVLVPSGQIPHKPTVNRSETQFSPFRPFTSPRHIFQNPTNLRSGKISVNNESCLATNHFGETGFFERVAILGRAAVLPDNCIANRFTRRCIPDNGGLPLVCDANRRNVRASQSKRSHSLRHHRIFRCPNFHRVVLHHSGLWEMLGKFLLTHGLRLTFPIENDCS